MVDKNKAKKETKGLMSSPFSEGEVQDMSLGFPDTEHSKSSMEGVHNINPDEEGIEITDHAQATESMAPPSDSATISNEDGFAVEDNRHSTSEPPNNVKSAITKLSWPEATHFHRDESILLVGNPNIFKSLDRYISGGLIALLGIIMSVHYLSGATNEYLQNNLPFGIQVYATEYYLAALVLVVVFGLAIVLWAHIQRLHTWYFITNQRSWVRAGVFSQQDLGSIDHESVNNVEEENPFPMNRWNVGHIRLFTASTDGSELEFGYLKNPTEWKAQVRDCMGSARGNTTPSEEDDI